MVTVEKPMRIRCAKCNKQVDSIYWRREEHSEDVLIRVTCHGDTDSMTIKGDYLMRLSESERRALEDQEGIAFVTQRIEATKEPS